MRYRVNIGALVSIAALTAMPTAASPSPAEASKLFETARAICARDGGRLWGQNICGPMLLVDYRDRSVLANQRDREGRLTSSGAWYAGVLPDDVIIANTPTDWAGVRWTQIVSPLPDDPARLQVLVAHELFHRIQDGLGLSFREGANRHLDTLEGRYLLQLEWRALVQALQAADEKQRLRAVGDALALRAERQRLFPAAATEEASLEINEGVPEYTGVMLGLATAAERIAYAIDDLSQFIKAPTLVRSFPYATGPAYGLLLDHYLPDWKSRLRAGGGFGPLLTSAVGAMSRSGASIAQLSARYDADGALRARETVRERDRQARLAIFRARLVTARCCAFRSRMRTVSSIPRPSSRSTASARSIRRCASSTTGACWRWRKVAPFCP